MRIKDYEKIISLAEGDVLAIDGSRGTKSMDPKQLVYENVMRNQVNNDEYWALVNRFCNGSLNPHTLRKRIYRGKNLGSSLTAEQKQGIKDGTFNDMFIGDYWTNGNVNFRIADFNYWLNKGDTSCTRNHIVIIPDAPLYDAVMNETHTTEGGYYNSKMRQENLTQAYTIYSNFFGANHLLNHRELFTNAVSNGVASSGDWCDTYVTLMNEIMVYGCQIFTPSSDGTVVPYNYTIDTTQLAIFSLWPTYINISRYWYWLRDVVSAAHFASVYGYGNSGDSDAGYSAGVRPVCGIVGYE